MKYMGLFSLLLAALIVMPFAGAQSDEVDPAGTELTLFRDVSAVNFATQTPFYQGDTITYTNSVMYTGSDTNSSVQNLDGCDITVVMGGSVGNVSTTVVASGYVISTNAGTWGAEMTVPAINPCTIQVTVSNVNEYTYQWQKINTKTKLED